MRYDFFLERGRFFQPQPLPKGHKRKKAKECYTNSYKLAFFGDGLTYCEGFVVFEVGKGKPPRSSMAGVQRQMARSST